MPDRIEFEWFSRSSGLPIVSIASYGLTFNAAAIEKLGSPGWVMLGFDRKRKILGVKPVPGRNEDDSEYAFPFATRARNGYVRIANRDLVKYISTHCPELNLEKTVRFVATWDEESKMLIVDLRRPIGGRGSEE